MSKHSDDDDNEKADSEKTEQSSINLSQEKPDIEKPGHKITGSIYKDSSKSSSPSANEDKDNDDSEESENENSDLPADENSNEQVETKKPRLNKLDKSATDNYLATKENDNIKDKLKHKKKKRKKTIMFETKKYQDSHHKRKPGSKNAGLSSINKGIKGKSKKN